MLAIFLILGAFCNAVMDIIDGSFDKSIFYKFNPYYWNPNYSWKNKHKYTGILFYLYTPFSDAWHFAKAVMIVQFCSIPLVYYPCFGIFDILIMFLFYSVFFELFYSVLLRREFYARRSA